MEAWRDALFKCHKLECISESGCLGKVKVGGLSAVCVPARSLKLVPTTCAQYFGQALSSALFEPSSNRSPADLLASRAFLSFDQGRVWVPIVNVKIRDIWLPG